MVTVFRFLQLKNALLLIFTIFVPIVTFVRFLLLLKAFAPMDLIYHRFSNSGMKFVVGCRFSFFQIDAMNCFLKILQSDLKVFFFLWKIALHQNDIFYFGNQDTDS